MRFVLRNKKVFLIAALAILSAAMFAGCGSTLADKKPVDEKTGLPKSEYPPAPPVIMQATWKKPDGTEFKLEDYKGKVVLVNLWGVWCGPCIKEMPDLVQLQADNKEKGFEIIGLNVGDDSGGPEKPENISSFGSEQKL